MRLAQSLNHESYMNQALKTSDMQENLIAKTLVDKLRSAYEQQFTGFYKVINREDKSWYIYFLLGRAVWAQSSKCSLRAWYRHIAIHSPVLASQIGQPVSLYYEYWNYSALSRLVKLKQFPRNQFSKIVESYVADVLFDILQANAWQYDDFGDLTIEVEAREAGNMPFVMLENLQSWKKAQQSWQQWQQSGLTKISPNYAPIIKDIDQLKEQTHVQAFQTLSSFANGENTLRDLALKVKQPIIPITRSIRPYVVKSLLSFTELPDIVEDANQGFHLELLDAHAPSDSSSAFTVQTLPEKSSASSKAIEEHEVASETQSNQSVVAASDKATAVDDSQNNESTQESVLVESQATKPEHTELVKSETSATDDIENRSEVLISSKKVIENEATVERSPLKSSALESPGPTVQHSSRPGDRSSERSNDELSVIPENVPEAPLQNVASTDNIISSNAENTDSKALIEDAKPEDTEPEDTKPSALSSVEFSSQDRAPLDSSDHKVKETQSSVDLDKGAKRRRRKTKNRQSRLPKVVYVDDSPADSRTMASIVENMGYQYLNIPDPLQALPMLIELKPKLIFLDLVMPIANGYEICAQIRRVSSFKKTPVVIVTSNDGIADRVRAKIVGASGFMGKPIKEKKVIKVFKKYLSYVEPMRR